MTIWYAIGLFCGMLGGTFLAMGRMAEPTRSDDVTTILGCDSCFLAVFTAVLTLLYWLRIRGSGYRRADAHFFALALGVLTPYVILGSMVAAVQLGSGGIAPVMLVGMWFFVWPLLAAELSVRYCRWRKVPPDSPAT